jgi:hypothetical protein
VALLTTERLPVALPASVGAKVKVRGALCPAVKVTGNAGPLRPKPLPLTVAWEIVTLPVPEFVTLIV